MTVLFAGGEDVSFLSNPAAITVTTSASFYRATFARCAVAMTNTTVVADPAANRLITPTFTPTSTLWIHGQLQQTLFTNTLNQQAMLIRSPDGVSRIVLRQTGVSGGYKVSTRNAAGTFVDLVTASAVLTSVGVLSFDMFVNYASGGGVQIWINGVLTVNYSGDPRTDSATQLNQVEISSFDYQPSYWSEVIVADQDTRGMSLWTMPPQASGNTQSWTPNTLANINKSIINDGTFISTTSINALSEWTEPTAAPSGNWNVLAVIQEARVQVGTSGPLHFDWLTRTGATDYLSGAPAAPITTFGNFRHTWATNPSTSAAWTVAQITTVGFNLGIESQT